jgi:hypothetical protein
MPPCFDDRGGDGERNDAVVSVPEWIARPIGRKVVSSAVR